jgi:Plavaka transposase
VLTDFSVAKRHRETPAYKKFARQLYHKCLAFVLSPLKDGMTAPVVMKCPDGFYRRVIYGLGPYIADYPEQVWLACVVQGWCPKYHFSSSFCDFKQLTRTFPSRCEALPTNLDDPNARLRSHIRTGCIIRCFDPGGMWDLFGIRGDVVVRASSLPSVPNS